IVSCTPVFNKRGQLEKIIHISTDITGLKKIEVALRESQERYQIAVSSSKSGAWEINVQTGKVYMDHSFTKFYGYTEKELENLEQLFGLLDSQERNEANQFIEQFAKGEVEENSFIYHIHRKDGAIAWFQTNGILVRDETGQPLRIVGISRDITEQKRAEKEMAALQEQLQQSQRMEAIGRLAGGIAHDFNNLLTIIQGNCELSLNILPEKDPLKANIEEISLSAERAATLTRQLLAFSRRQLMEMKVMDLNMTLHNLDKMLRRVIGEDIELITILAKDLGKIKADQGQIEQVIMNLILNARDAMPRGGSLIMETSNFELDEHYVQAHINVAPGQYVLLSISDTGCGMTPDIKEKIFDPFFTTKGKGTGLGLSTVYGIVKQTGGSISVYSEPSKGTTFKIYLPRIDEPFQKEKKQKMKESMSGGGETVLIVEDDDMVRKLAVRILQQRGYKIIEAENPKQALSLCKKQSGKIDLILTDVVMPSMSGNELVKKIKKIRPEIKVLYMSGYPDNSFNHHAFLEKGINYIQKPFSTANLAQKIRKVLDK
ncbi:MAG: hypothetical protein A2Y62_07110, partial [Candidatus Fischerbacteria bacterium RBG_13_37_8]